MPDPTPPREPAELAALQARLDDMAPLSDDGTRRYARVAGDYLAELAADAITALRAAAPRPDVPDVAKALRRVKEKLTWMGGAQDIQIDYHQAMLAVEAIETEFAAAKPTPEPAPARWHHSPDAPPEHFCEDCDALRRAALATPDSGLDVEQLATAILRCIEAAPSRKAWEDASIRQQAMSIAAALVPQEADR